MTERACNEAGYADMKQYLTGMTALALSENDPIAPAKVLKKYADKIETFEIKAGFIDGGVIDQKGVIALADIPDKDTLVCKIMLGMRSSLQGLAYVLQAVIDKANEGGAAEAPAAE
jgi:large subunit ribosomal protein L10